MKLLGRWLQYLGLIILPLAMFLEFTQMLGRNGVAEMLIMLVFGASSFMLGRYIEGYAASQ